MKTKKMKEIQTNIGWNADQPKIEEPLPSAFANCRLPMLPFKRFPVILLRDFPSRIIQIEILWMRRSGS